MKAWSKYHFTIVEFISKWILFNQWKLNLSELPTFFSSFRRIIVKIPFKCLFLFFRTNVSFFSSLFFLKTLGKSCVQAGCKYGHVLFIYFVHFIYFICLFILFISLSWENLAFTRVVNTATPPLLSTLCPFTQTSTSKMPWVLFCFLFCFVFCTQCYPWLLFFLCTIVIICHLSIFSWYSSWYTMPIIWTMLIIIIIMI